MDNTLKATKVEPSPKGMSKATTSRGQVEDGAIEEQYTVAEIAKRWKLSIVTIRKLFEDESGVMKVMGKTGKRSRMRIPKSVMERVQRRMQVG